MSYYEICENIKGNGWTEAYDENAQCPFAYKGDQWVGYDNVKSIQLKTEYALSQNLGGIMFWVCIYFDFIIL
jgi:chitinase